MEEIRFKIGNSKNPHVIDGAFVKLEALIRSKPKDGTTDLEELRLTWECCKHENQFVASASAKCLVSLVETGHLEVSPTLTTLLSITSQVKHASGLVNAVGDLLMFKIKHISGGSTDQGYKIAARPHPFIVLLRATPSAWPFVLSKTEELLSLDEWSLKVFNNLKPFLLFIFCDPHQHDHFAALRFGLLHFLLRLRSQEPDLKTDLDHLFHQLLAWMGHKSVVAHQETVKLSLLILNDMNDDVRLLYLCAFAQQSIQHGLNPEIVVQEIDLILKNSSVERDQLLIAVTILSRCVWISRNTSQSRQLVKLIAIVFQHLPPHPILKHFVIASIISSLSNKAKLSPDMCQTLDAVIQAPVDDETKPVLQAPTCSLNQSCVTEAVQLLKVITVELDTESGIENYLKSTLNYTNWNRDLYDCHLLMTLGLNQERPDEAFEALSVLVQMSRRCVELAHDAISLILYRLSASDMTPNQKLDWMKQLPKLGHDRSCVSLILQLVSSMTLSPKLSPLRLQILHELYQEENRVYPFLMKALEEKVPHDVAFGFTLAKAKALRDICKAKPKQHGPDVLPKLSTILNDCINDRDATTCILALDGIHHLCKEGVIDIRTTVKVLHAKLWNDHRRSVTLKYLTILALIPTFDFPYNEEYNAFRKSTLVSLWSKALKEDDQELKNGLFQTILAFSHEDYTFQALPSFAKTELRYPQGYNPPLEGPVPDPEEVWKFIPGDCFVQLLVKSSDQNFAYFRDVIGALVDEEVENLPRGVYYLSAAKLSSGSEPPNYSHLDEKSLLRSLVSHLLGCNSGKFDTDSRRLRELVLILAQPRPRPLPPFDWTLLRHNKDYEEELLVLSTRQCQASASAKKMVTSALETSSLPANLANLLLINLNSFAAHVDAISLEPFVQDLLLLSQAPRSHDIILKVLAGLDTDSEELTRDTVDQSPCQALLQLVQSVLAKVIGEGELSTSLMEAFLTKLPSKRIEWVINEVMTSDATPDTQLRAFTLNCHLLGQSKAPLTLSSLNPSLDRVSKCDNFQSILQPLMAALTFARPLGDMVSRQWILELMGRISSIARGDDPHKRTQLNSLLLVFVLALEVFAEVDGLVSANPASSTQILDFFPMALIKLLGLSSTWNGLGAQLGEWMIHLQDKTCDLPLAWQTTFEKAMNPLQRCDKYLEASLWGKLVLVTDKSITQQQ